MTVTAQVAVLPQAVAVMVAVPTAFAVTTPEPLTEAMVGSELVQLIVWPLASAGVSVAVSVSVRPRWISVEDLFRLMVRAVCEVEAVLYASAESEAETPPSATVVTRARV